MAVILQRKSSSGLSVIPANKSFRVSRLKTDLDHSFVEASTQIESSQINLPYIDLYGFPIDTSHLTMISKEDMIRTKMGVFSLSNKEIHLATTNPGLAGQEAILNDFKTRNFTFKLYLCSPLSLEKMIKTYNAVIKNNIVSDEINLDAEKISKMAKTVGNFAELAESLKRVSTSEVIETILISALENKASDIHFEPEKDNYHIRLRLDGVLHNLVILPRENQRNIESRLKILAGVKINVDNIPQDGRFSFKYDGKDIDVRVSMLPSNYGYSVVMRLLGTGNVNLALDDLGFLGIAKERVQLAIQKTQGLILTTGPTGSGKTTTLYTLLSDLNDGETKIITLEDPIEYKLAGVSQTQIDAEAGYTFSSGLRSILRQDPDVVMIGEIRDGETAEIAVQASLTGHQVLSTIHTNDAAGAIPRLMEMGVRGFVLVDSLSAIIGQRLVRRLCQHCQVNDNLNDLQKQTVLEQLRKIPEEYRSQIPRQLSFKTCKGCEHCNKLGYKGRVGVYEVLTVTDGLKQVLANQFPSSLDVRNIAVKEGMLTMFQDGILKALKGMTDIKELMKNVS
jgi:type II secretory ATPase GspE/PulE/Tfp pilus assembly ATPase PilB-like protein